MLNYLIRDIPPSLWVAAKHLAADSGKSLKQIILDALRAYIEGAKK